MGRRRGGGRGMELIEQLASRELATFVSSLPVARAARAPPPRNGGGPCCWGRDEPQCGCAWPNLVDVSGYSICHCRATQKRTGPCAVRTGTSMTAVSPRCICTCQFNTQYMVLILLYIPCSHIKHISACTIHSSAALYCVFPRAIVLCGCSFGESANNATISNLATQQCRRV